MLGPSGIGLDDIVSSRIGLAAATLCLAIGTGKTMFAQGQADAVAGYETMMLIGALLVLVLFGKIVRRRPVQRTGALAIFVVLLLALVMLAVALISSR
jgi:hypothetical protein